MKKIELQPDQIIDERHTIIEPLGEGRMGAVWKASGSRTNGSHVVLKMLDGVDYRLPSEAEWEYACRSGSESAFHFGSDELKLSQYGWIAGNCLRAGEYAASFHIVGKKHSNSFGLHHVHGNVSEWCADWYGEDYYAESSHRDPQGPNGGDRRYIAVAVGVRLLRAVGQHTAAGFRRRTKEIASDFA